MAAPSVIESPAPALSQSTWSAIGPASLQSGYGLDSGRITGIAVDPTDSNTIYIAAAGGGVWKTTDGGTTWMPLTDNQTTLSIGSIAIAPGDPLKIYAGTGEANNSADSNHGKGILVSDDGGSTWALETAGGAFDGVAIGQIAVDPADENVAYAAVGGYTNNGSFYTNQGIWKTTDGGTTWTNVTSGVEPYATEFAWTSVVIDPNTPVIVYAAAGDVRYSTYGGYTVNGVYRSTDGGTTWTLLSNAPNGGNNSATGRIALAVSPAASSSGQHVLYVAAESRSTLGLLYFGRSDNADAATPTFTDLTSGTPNFLGSQGWYDIALNVDANGVVYADGVSYGSNILRSTNLGVTWTDITEDFNGNEPHTDHHAIIFDSSNRMLDGNDGGIWRYDPAGSGSWTDLNGNLNTIQFEGIGLAPISETTVVGGSQDNGTELTSDNPVWSEVDGGDGGLAQISQTNPSRCYAIHPIPSYGADFFQRSDSGCASGTWTPEVSGIIYDFADFYPPFVVDHTDGDHLLIGLDRVYESTDGATSWTPISTPGSNGFITNYNVDTIALSPANGPNPEVVYAATENANGNSLIFVSTNDGGSWTENNLPSCTSGAHYATGCRVNEVVVDPSDPTGMTAVAVIREFTGRSGGHVYRTTDGGSTWTDIGIGLPDLPTWSVQVDTDANHTIYISNDTGVYSSPSPYTTWTAYGTGLPNAQGYDLELNSSVGLLAVATHGRGAWEILTPGASTPATMSSPAPNSTLAPGSTTFNWTAGSSGTTGYYLWVGSSPGTYNLANLGEFSGTSATVNLPTNGVPVYVRLWTVFNGTTLQYNDYTYTEAAAIAGNIQSPAPDTTLAVGSTTFTWIAGYSWTGGYGDATGYYLWIGTSPGTYNLANLGEISGTSATVSLPTSGATIYVRLWTVFNGSATEYDDYTYTEATATPAAIINPAPNGTLISGSATTFTWTMGSSGATGYYLWAGTSPGSYDLANRGEFSGTSATVTLPTSGTTIFVRLWTVFNGTAFQYHDYTYTLAAATPGAITNPAPGNTLAAGPTTFTWTTGSSGTTGYYLWIGTSPGTYNLSNLGEFSGTSATVTLPTSGATLYVRLWTVFNGNTLVYNDYIYTEATAAPGVISIPASGSTLIGDWMTSNCWPPGSSGTTEYHLWAGKSPGAFSPADFGQFSADLRRNQIVKQLARAAAKEAPAG